MYEKSSINSQGMVMAAAVAEGELVLFLFSPSFPLLFSSLPDSIVLRFVSAALWDRLFDQAAAINPLVDQAIS